jgi:hypothetical protein
VSRRERSSSDLILHHGEAGVKARGSAIPDAPESLPLRWRKAATNFLAPSRSRSAASSRRTTETEIEAPSLTYFFAAMISTSTSTSGLIS